MRFKKVDCVRDGGNHAVAADGGTWKCVFCGLETEGPSAFVFTKGSCPSRARPIQVIGREVFDAIWNKGTATEIVFTVENHDRIIEMAGYRFKA